MGICAAQKQQKNTDNGELSQIMLKVRLSNDSHDVLKEKTKQSGTFNPFKNPIVTRRFQEISVQSNRSLLE